MIGRQETPYKTKHATLADMMRNSGMVVKTFGRVREKWSRDKAIQMLGLNSAV